MIKLQLHPDARMLRQFAWAALFAFPLIAWSFIHKTFHLADPWAYGVAALGPLVFVADFAGLRAFTRAMFRFVMLVSFPIGFVIFPILIGLIYYGLFTPIGWLFRLIGRDTMHRSFDPKTSTYWHTRGAPRPASSYFKLY
jgi:hypothetical protein